MRAGPKRLNSTSETQPADARVTPAARGCCYCRYRYGLGTGRSDSTHWRLADDTDTDTEILNWLSDHSRLLLW